MPTYTYETIEKAGREPRIYEIDQRMGASPLECHPETGERIRRIITADRGILAGKGAPACGSDCGLPGSGSGGGGCCGGACGHRH